MKKLYKNNNQTNMSIMEHLAELRARLFIAFALFCIITILCLIYIKDIAYILQEPALGIKFLQLAPGEYLFVSIKIALYSGLIFSSPFSIYQIMLFILPGLTEKEASYIIPTLIASIILFFFGITFSYKILVPAALNFLINYGSEIVEPIWSFEEYFNFILLLLFSTGICFQIPIIQILLGYFKIFSSNDMLKNWKYIIFISTIIGAIITPSTDPITQLFMTMAIFLLYLSGIFVLKILNK
uniref:Sec-independent protein translocase component TatC n=1 Tax=Acrosorium ciliolatum TaxID=1550622 RepID=A0A1Z1M288_9FLOR|nr:Sec-independent protein translocase component TatC [Acrosorium ciliolatum]ARW60010.1 Sec-independent protein translocase component TatC [Acrosorium ciliolatum]